MIQQYPGIKLLIKVREFNTGKEVKGVIACDVLPVAMFGSNLEWYFLFWSEGSENPPNLTNLF